VPLIRGSVGLDFTLEPALLGPKRGRFSIEEVVVDAVVELVRVHRLDTVLYRPTTSRTFSTKNGSADSLNVSIRCGCREKARHTRLTADCDIPMA
jgi:hypothetical protein